MRISDWSSDVCSSDLSPASARSPSRSWTDEPDADAADAGLRPGDLGGQAHQDRLDVAAGLQAEQRAAVMQQVELDVAAAPNQLVASLRLGPAIVHVPLDEARVDVEECLSDVAGEGEVGLEVAVEIVVDDAADAARAVAELGRAHA